jgi:uncharacterized C2H2 Zn-finger protein
MEEVLECGSCGDVFSSEETLKKHADFKHGHKKVEIKDGRAGEGLFSRILKKLRGK